MSKHNKSHPSACPPLPRPKVAVVYHFFAHYRTAVMNELIHNSNCEFIAVGDDHDPTKSGIEAWKNCPSDRFIHAPCRKLFGPIMLQRGLLRLAIRRDLDAIIFLGNVFWPMTWLAAILARLTGKKVLFWTHGWIHQENGIIGAIRRRFYKIAHGLLLYGRTAKIIGIECGFDAESLHVICNSLDYECQKSSRSRVTDHRIRALREELFPKSNRPLIICTTRLIPVRRLDQLLEAMILLEKENHPVNLLLVGDGPEKESLQKFAAEKNLAVHFYGPCYDEDKLAELVMAANVTVAPGKVGLTAMHSLAFGTPVITHDDINQQMPEWESIIPGQNGDLFKHGNIEDLARVIGLWTTSQYPDESIRKTCHKIIDQFYNPAFQRRAIERAIAGQPADDLFWLKESTTKNSGFKTHAA